MTDSVHAAASTTTQRAYTAEQLATAWQVSKSHIYEQMAAGDLPYFTVGRSRRVLVQDAEEYERTHRSGRCAS